MTAPVYPTGFLSWTDVQDDETTIAAAQVNSLAAEVGALETTLGTNPEIEESPASGVTPQVFDTVGDRISFVQNGEQLPVTQLSTSALTVSSGLSAGTNYGVWNTYTANYDPYNCYNGNDITVPVTGWWRFTSNQFWNWWSTGYCMTSLWINNVASDQDIWHWDFAGNSRTGAWQNPPGNLPSPVFRAGFTKLFWEGQVSAGTRVRVLSENGTTNAQLAAFNLSLTAALVRTT